MHKALSIKQPEYIHKRLKTVERVSRTTDKLTLVERRLKTVTACKSFLPRTINDWNSLPYDLRSVASPSDFKKQLKVYIKENVPVK